MISPHLDSKSERSKSRGSKDRQNQGVDIKKASMERWLKRRTSAIAKSDCRAA